MANSFMNGYSGPAGSEASAVDLVGGSTNQVQLNGGSSATELSASSGLWYKDGTGLYVTGNLDVLGTSSSFNGSLTVTKQLQGGGTSTTGQAFPGISFDGDNDTGIWLPEANRMIIVAGGSQLVDINNNNAKQFAVSNAGSATVPVWSYAGDPNTGIYFPAADQLAITTGGKQAVLFVSGATNEVHLTGSTRITGSLAVTHQSLFSGGTTELPGIAFNHSPDTGINSNEDNYMAFVCAGTSVFSFHGGLLTCGTSVQGSSVYPALYIYDATNGFYSTAGTYAIGITTNSIQRMYIAPGQTQITGNLNVSGTINSNATNTITLPGNDGGYYIYNALGKTIGLAHDNGSALFYTDAQFQIYSGKSAASGPGANACTRILPIADWGAGQILFEIDNNVAGNRIFSIDGAAALTLSGACSINSTQPAGATCAMTFNATGGDFGTNAAFEFNDNNTLFNIKGNGYANAGAGYQVGGTQVITSRQTGQLSVTGSASAGTEQELKDVVNALIAKLTTHGLISA